MTSETRRLGRIALVFAALVAVMTAHELEHVIQVAQKYVAGSACPNDCRGLLGFAFDLEWVHFAYNATILAALLALYAWARLWRSEWRARFGWVLLSLGIAVQGYHVVEHVQKLSQWFANGGHSPTPGILGQEVSLVELHFALNTLVFALVVGGFFALGFHRLAWSSRSPGKLATAVGLTLVALAGSAWIWTERPPTISLGSGVHQGPIVLDSPARLVGEPGAVVLNGIVVKSDDVVVRDLEVRGGENGIEVHDSTNVLLQGVAISGARMDAIHARRSSVTIRGCDIRMSGDYKQGIDISFAFDLPGSRVSGCRVEGGQEGIVSHMAHVDFSENEVRRTTMRAIAVTEMSMGTVRDNVVEDAAGVGIYCGDYAMCEIRDNAVRGTTRDEGTHGYAVLSHFWARAEVGDNRFERNAGDVHAYANGIIETD